MTRKVYATASSSSETSAKIPSVSEKEHVTFLVGEIDADIVDIGFGVGHGLTRVSPQWITKITVGKML
jgi:hypothetical protein